MNKITKLVVTALYRRYSLGSDLMRITVKPIYFSSQVKSYSNSLMKGITTNKLNLTDVLTKFQIGANVISKCSWISAMDVEEVNNKLVLISKLNYSFDAINLVQLSYSILSEVMLQRIRDNLNKNLSKKFNSRLEYLAHHLECPVEQLMDNIYHHFFLLTMDFDRLDRVLKTLLKNGISSADIAKDVWALRANELDIYERIPIIQKTAVPIKTWMLRCPKTFFDHYLKKETIDRNILGAHDNIVSYLSKRLKCDPLDIIAMGERYPRVLAVNLPKIETLLDYFFKEGFTPAEIMFAPRVFDRKIETIKERLKILQNLNFRPISLNVLCLTEKQFHILIKKISSAKYKSKKRGLKCRTKANLE